MGELPAAGVSDSGLVHLSLPETVHRLLRRRILNNEIVAGSRLVEATVAEELNVSRSTVRVALQQLAREGLVEITPRRHSVVTRMSYEEVEDACYARYVLEDGAMRAVPDERLPELAEQLAEVTTRMLQAARSGDLAAVVDLDTEYHGCILRESGRHRLAGLWSTLDAQMGALMRSSFEDQHVDLVAAVDRHTELTRVIGAGEAVATGVALHDHYLRR